MGMEEQDTTDYQAIRNYETQTILNNTLAEVLLDMNKQIDILEHDLKGEFMIVYKDEETGDIVEEWRQGETRLLNDDGVRFVISMMHSYLTPNTFLSVLDDEDIERIMSRIHINLAILLVRKQRIWAINPEYMNTMEDKITNILWIALKRSLNSKTLDTFGKTQKSSEIRETKPKGWGIPFISRR